MTVLSGKHTVPDSACRRLQPGSKSSFSLWRALVILRTEHVKEGFGHGTGGGKTSLKRLCPPCAEHGVRIHAIRKSHYGEGSVRSNQGKRQIDGTRHRSSPRRIAVKAKGRGGGELP